MQVRRHPQLQEIALSDDYAVVFAPSWSRVTVLNGTARALLGQFELPQSPARRDATDIDTIQQMYALGLLVAQGQALPPPDPADELVAWLHVTNACNLRCTYCYVNKSDEAMSAETAFAAVDAVLRSARRHGYRKVLIKYAGGEASLNLSLVEELHRYVLEQAARADSALRGVVLSNGVGLSRAKMERLQALGVRLMISLDGPREVHDAQRPRLGGQGSFDAVIAGIERAQQIGIDLTVSITVTGASSVGLPEVVKWLLERNVHFSLNFYRECDSSARFDVLQLEEQRLIEGMRGAYQVIEGCLPRYSLLGSLLDRSHLGTRHDRACAVGENYLVINQRGQIAKCQMEIERPVTNIWVQDPLEAIRLDTAGVQNVPVDDKEGCRTCQWRYWCAGGCAVATFRATGRYDIKSPNCAVYKALYPEVIRLEGLRLIAQAQLMQAAA